MTDTQTRTETGIIAPEVIIDGVRYTPADDRPRADGLPRIGIGITTHNRPNEVAYALGEHSNHLPPNAVVVVVDDASTEPVVGADYRFETNVGIARAKNKCLELLMAADPAPDHIFLFDDDAYPIADGWHLPYIESPEPHLMYQFLDLASGPQLHDLREIHHDGQHIAYSGPRGPMLYLDARVLPIVGGLDPIFGLFGYEHGDWSNRIHAAGLTTWRYADIVGSENLIHSKDEYREVERSIPRRIREEHVARNIQIHNERRDAGYAGYVEYREPRDIILTSLYASKPDPQRPGSPALTADAMVQLMGSLQGQDVVLVTDVRDAQLAGTSIHYAEVHGNLYVERHVAAWQYLRDHPEVRYVWCVDATDVVMQASPFAEMEPGLLYLGWEPKIVSDPWMIQHHQAHIFTGDGGLFARHGHRQLLNMGVLGGDRETVMAFLHGILQAYYDNAVYRALGAETKDTGIGDMALGNLIAYDRFDGCIITGSRVATLFKHNETNGFSWWRHK